MAESQSPDEPDDRPRAVTVTALAKQLLLPLPLLPLFVTPWEIFSSMFWIAGGIAVCVSVIKLVRMAWSQHRGRIPSVARGDFSPVSEVLTD